MLCATCLGVLEECQNLIVDDSYWCTFPTTMAGKSIFRQGTIDTTAPESGLERTALLKDATSHHADVNGEESHVGTALNICDMSSDEGKLAQPCVSDSQPVCAVQSERSNDTSALGRHAIYGHHATLADLEEAARDGCQICWQVWDLLSNDKSKIAAGVSEAHEAVESAKTHFCTCLVLNNDPPFRPESTDYMLTYYNVDVYYDGPDSPQRVCGFTSYSRFRMYGPSSNCYSC